MTESENSKASKLNEILLTTKKEETIFDMKVTNETSQSNPSIKNTKDQQHMKKEVNVEVEVEVEEKKEKKEEVEEEEYIIQNSYGIYNWARFQIGPIKANEIKEMYPELHINVIERCIKYLVKMNKMKVFIYIYIYE